jgi:hypothetical protein
LLDEQLDDLLRSGRLRLARALGRRPDVAIRAAALPVRPLDTAVTVVRPDDLLVLTFDRRNLRLETDERGAHLVKAGDGPAYLVVDLQPQHLVERAYFQTALDRGFPIGVPGDEDGAKLSALSQPNHNDPDKALDAQDDPDPPEQPPIPALVSGPSRLVFRVPDEELPLKFTLEGLLDAMGRLELNVAPNALPPPPQPTLAQRLAAFGGVRALDEEEAKLLRPAALLAVSRARRKARITDTLLGVSTVSGSASLATLDVLSPPGRAAAWPGVLGRIFAPVPEPPIDDETAIEVPYRLIVSPTRRGTWFHRDAPGSSAATGKTELWHTRLGARLDNGQRVDGVHPENVLRAIWSFDPEMAATVEQGEKPFAGLTHRNDDPWRMSLDAVDRVNVVHLSSNFRLDDENGGPYLPRPLDVDLFMLSSLGAWMDTRGEWTSIPAGLSVEEWRHRATLGRDHYVRVVYAGFAFPFGHRCSLVKVTERRFHSTPSGRRAYLRQRMFLVFRELVRTYRNTGRHYKGDQLDLKFPFETVRITTRVSPDLDPPTDPFNDQSCFWPYVGDKPLHFHVVATDVAGNIAEMSMPLMFVGKEVNDLGPDITLEQVAAKYSEADNGQRARVELHGQKVAFAASETADDTAFAVESLTFAGVLPDDYKTPVTTTKPRWVPVVAEADVDIPSLQVLGGTSAASAVQYADIYLANGFGGTNAGDVFLAAVPTAATTEVAFSKRSDRSGGFVAPDLSLAGVSRLTGPVSGDLDTVAQGDFDAAKFFPTAALDGAKLFGAIRLADLIAGTDPANGGADQLTQLPRFAGQSLNPVEQLLGDLEQLTHDLKGTNVGDDVVASIGAFTAALGALPHDGDPSGAVAQLADVETKLTALAGDLATLSPGLQAVVKQRLDAIGPVLTVVLEPSDGAATMLARFVRGDVLPEALVTRFEWRPTLASLALLTVDDGGGLVVAVEARAKAAAGDPQVTVTASLDNFTLNLVAVVLGFEHVQFRTRQGKKPDIDVRLRDKGVAFDGPLKFVEDLKSLIPFDGFSDPPSVDVTEDGITAGFSVGLPNIGVGVLSLENLSLAAGFAVPFVGPPMSVWFRFCEREHPAQLTVMMFGGGAFFGVTMNADGLQVLEAAFEFGAAISVDFGVASGGVSAMAGIYFKLEVSDAQLTGYFRLRGEVEALGIVSVCIELYLDLTYEFSTEKAVGSATISLEIDVALFSTTIEISTTKKFAGSGDDPTFAEMFDVQLDPGSTSSDWEHYCAAFA